MKYCIDCSKNNIKKTSTYGNIDEQIPKYCAPCSKNKIGKIVNFKHGYCEYIVNLEGKLLSEKLCCENANFNYHDAKVKKGIRCLNHKEEKMICIGGHLCKDCLIKQASFILHDSGKKTPTHCGDCIKKYENENENLKKLDVSHKKCIICNEKNAIFGLKDSTKKEYCGICAKNMDLEVYDLHHKKCINCNVETALYNIIDETPLYCSNCKTEEMILIHKKLCIKCNVKTPVFNLHGIKKGIYCNDCKTEDMINVMDKLCEKCNIKRPSFNKVGENRPIYCNDCKTNDMINIYYNLCDYEDCDNYALYNHKDEAKPKYCRIHCEEGMISVNGKLCIIKDCDKHAIFNYENETKRLYCFIHASNDMVDIVHKKCIVCNEYRAIFNNYGEKSPLYCNLHKTSLMVKLEHKLCKTYMCGKRAIEKYEDYCLTCYINIYPEKPLSRNYKTKESDVVKYILKVFPGFTWVSDKSIIDGCSQKRPDLLLDLGYQVINIEIDENQHKSYEEICENKRLMLISKDIQHRNLILIRFNPDGYTINNEKHLSCWNINKETGLCTIKKTYEKAWLSRLKKLEETIKYWTNPENISEKMIHVIHLFFDESIKEKDVLIV